jgi:hypothetical protein
MRHSSRPALLLAVIAIIWLVSISADFALDFALDWFVRVYELSPFELLMLMGLILLGAYWLDERSKASDRS